MPTWAWRSLNMTTPATRHAQSTISGNTRWHAYRRARASEWKSRRTNVSLLCVFWLCVCVCLWAASCVCITSIPCVQTRHCDAVSVRARIQEAAANVQKDVCSAERHDSCKNWIPNFVQILNSIGFEFCSNFPAAARVNSVRRTRKGLCDFFHFWSASSAWSWIGHGFRARVLIRLKKTEEYCKDLLSSMVAPFRYSRKFKIDKVESYRIIHHLHFYREWGGAVFFFHKRGRGGEGVFFYLYVKCNYVHLHTQLDSEY